ncbi:hypothetical protein KC363_g218 [Hortaea werneckii]|nr:hypothetical protein KC363_g218 [Hortaea werneckii]
MTDDAWLGIGSKARRLRNSSDGCGEGSGLARIKDGDYDTKVEEEDRVKKLSSADVSEEQKGRLLKLAGDTVMDLEKQEMVERGIERCP